jgi:hypothetical protein
LPPLLFITLRCRSFRRHDTVSTPFFAADLPPRRADCRIFAIIYSLIRRFAAGFDSRHFRRRFAARRPAAAIVFASQPLLLPLRQSAISIFSALFSPPRRHYAARLPITPLLEPFHTFSMIAYAITAAIFH